VATNAPSTPEASTEAEADKAPAPKAKNPANNQTDTARVRKSELIATSRDRTLYTLEQVSTQVKHLSHLSAEMTTTGMR
jgi:hypothetical protein